MWSGGCALRARRWRGRGRMQGTRPVSTGDGRRPGWRRGHGVLPRCARCHRGRMEYTRVELSAGMVRGTRWDLRATTSHGLPSRDRGAARWHLHRHGGFAMWAARPPRPTARVCRAGGGLRLRVRRTPPGWQPRRSVCEPGTGLCCATECAVDPAGSRPIPALPGHTGRAALHRGVPVVDQPRWSCRVHLHGVGGGRDPRARRAPRPHPALGGIHPPGAERRTHRGAKQCGERRSHCGVDLG
jgi:hypothetical protein